MRFTYDLAQASPIVRDLLIYDSSALYAGEAMCGTAIDLTDGEGGGGVISCDPVAMIDMVGVLQETPANAISVMETGTDYTGKVIINPLAVYLAEWDMDTPGTNDTPDSDGDTIIDVGILATNEAGWAYVNGPSTDTGYGNLFKVGNQDSTTTLECVDGAAYDDELTANTGSSTYILIRRPFVNDSKIDLTTIPTKLDGDPLNPAGDALVLENYISHSRFPMEPLRTARHSGKHVPGAIFYGDLYFTDHLLRGLTTHP